MAEKAPGGVQSVERVFELLELITDAGGDVSIVASCDVYDFDDERITEIVSYTVELPS